MKLSWKFGIKVVKFGIRVDNSCDVISSRCHNSRPAINL